MPSLRKLGQSDLFPTPIVTRTVVRHQIIPERLEKEETDLDTLAAKTTRYRHAIIR